ncbi:uncharacterized protein LOC122507611 [Leptopilina heterotoma]|uniref:uncharacterized protein LOC122507611 n=1 Tax=Leptopilina heterotoma TaxID=63436 RepID=UPI001CA9AB7C|nr:uncharacterized protein LOC122507611 [Leptopilina heterotoma]
MSEESQQSNSNQNSSSNTLEKEASINCHVRSPSQVYLATAIVDVLDSQGRYQPCRVMLDGGAQSCTITSNCVSRLGLKQTPFEIPLLSIDDMSTNVKFKTSTTIRSPDPKFNEPSPIDIIIGAEYTYNFLGSGKLSIKGHSAVLQNTTLGWILAGRIFDVKQRHNTNSQASICNFLHNTSLPLLWELDQVQPTCTRSKEEEECETHYKENTFRDDSGSYVVKLPFNEKVKMLGESKRMAFQRFYSLEKRFERDPLTKKSYLECVNNYLDEGHMKEVTDKASLDSGYYLPHHAVKKEGSLTTETRVVFDGSTKTDTDLSLNDCLKVGPTIQNDIFSIFTRFRSHPVALTADIKQMYRQVKVHPSDSIYQRILWRNNPNEPIKIYELNRVTFGTACAPFLATRTLLQLAEDERESFPVASHTLKRDFYVDDLVTGAESYEKALSLRNNLMELLKKGGFNLRKWGSNDSRLTRDFPGNPTITHMSLDPSDTIKTLGVYWDSKTDSITYTVNIPKVNEKITKRSILSQVAKLFDPLGLLGPIIVKAKILIQLLWKAKLEWDEPVPHKLQTSWLEYKNELELINDVRFERFIVIPNAKETQIHGFCDASTKAYGACVYLRSTDDQGNIQCSLIAAKSRVAPLKCVTLPKLELCSALVLTKLYTSIAQSIPMSFNKIFFWSDSTIALNWIKTQPYNLPTFEANRVAEIQKVTPDQWFHVPTECNPADLISRGQGPREFVQTTIWRNGPVWLSQPPEKWPKSRCMVSDQAKKVVTEPVTTLTLTNFVEDQSYDHCINIYSKHSNLKSLKRIFAYCLRFIHNIKIKNASQKVKGPLSIQELDEALLGLIKLTQVFGRN